MLICMSSCKLVEIFDQLFTAERTSEQISDLEKMLCCDWLVHAGCFFNYHSLKMSLDCPPPLKCLDWPPLNLVSVRSSET